jgi:uncharacterized membrane protein
MYNMVKFPKESEEDSMRSRQEIKALAKQRFRENYWPCVAVPILVSVISGLVAGLVIRLAGQADAEEVSVGLSLVIAFFIAGPLSIGLCYFFVQVILGHEDEITVGTPFRTAVTGYMRKVGGYAWMSLFQYLWTMLFIVPGIIKSFSYAMTPYILGDCPNVGAQDALKLSMRIMNGKKADLFVLYLSFLGWAILSVFTLGVLAIFYVQPYATSAVATFYLEAREDALRKGTITLGQLNGVEDV